MGGACSTYRNKKKYVCSFGRKTYLKRSLGKPKRTYEDNSIKTDLKEKEWRAWTDSG
jgi:hypothetical protein